MTYLRFCSLQSGCFKASHNDFAPLSPISLPFRSRCIRFWLWVKVLEIPWQTSGKEVNLNLQKKKYTGEITSSSLSLITTSFSSPALRYCLTISAISYLTPGFSYSRSRSYTQDSACCLGKRPGYDSDVHYILTTNTLNFFLTLKEKKV